MTLKHDNLLSGEAELRERLASIRNQRERLNSMPQSPFHDVWERHCNRIAKLTARECSILSRLAE